jgi:hypothetical protein
MKNFENALIKRIKQSVDIVKNRIRYFILLEPIKPSNILRVIIIGLDFIFQMNDDII